ncbi:MAG: type II toxin-antitoxin system RelE/ParE family toxin [Verrucomicrobia bacterium]|nr:type II toxin-antitoxin system RelE/ParE family toxin [Verrucomicrobiota bacterium]
MGFKVILSPQAIERLEEIVRYIARDNPSAAERFGMRLIDQAQLLGDFPEVGSPYRKRPGVRRLLCKPYFIYYRVKEREQVVEVLDYWHSARQEPELL